jgi:hypothetical protein
MPPVELASSSGCAWTAIKVSGALLKGFSLVWDIFVTASGNS